MENTYDKYQRYVITHPDQGIYLGCFMGLGFWSKLDAAGQDSAATFESIEQAKEHISSWDMNNDTDQYMFIQVTSSSPLYATISECVNAGLPAWSSQLPQIMNAPDDQEMVTTEQEISGDYTAQHKRKGPC